MKLLNRRPVIAFTSSRQPEIGIFRHYFARFYFWLAGWQVTGYIPNDKKLVVMAVYHTSNWDGWNLVMTSWIVRTPIRWMVKAEWTRFPIIGWLVRSTGAIGIDRQASRNTVEWAVEQFRKNDKFILAVPPEGTRKKTDHWRTGFYWIAYQAGVPIKISIMDYGRKQIDFSAPNFTPTGDIEADMEYLWKYVRDSGARGLHPEKQSEMRLRPTAIRHAEHINKHEEGE